MASRLPLLFAAGAAVLMLGASGPSAQQAEYTNNFKYNSGQGVQPVFEGWSWAPDGSINMHFGYLNRNYVQEPAIPVGANNNIQPGGPDRGQPTYFYARTQRNMFTVNIPKDWDKKRELIWTVTVNGKTERAVGWLQSEWEIDPVGGAGTGGRTDEEYVKNKPPTYHAGHRCARQASGDRHLDCDAHRRWSAQAEGTRQAGGRTGNAADASGRHRRASQRAGRRRSQRARNAAWSDRWRRASPGSERVLDRLAGSWRRHLLTPPGGTQGWQDRHHSDLYQAGRVRPARDRDRHVEDVQPGRQSHGAISRGPVPRQFLLPAAALALAIAWAGLTSSETMPGPREAASNRPLQQREDGYTSSDSCQACHPSQYATWHRSYHRTMTQVASSSTVRADFAGVQVDAVHGRPMRLTRNGERFFAEFDDPDWSGAEGAAPRISREVVMITGSHHQQIYWYATGRDRLLGQLPGAYLIAERQWIPRRTAVLHPPSDPVFSETGHWNAVCIACHTTSGKPEFDTPFGSAPVESQTVQSRVAEFGIACEACHGPGEAHVAANRNPARRYRQHFGDTADETTTQPMRLAANVSSQVCGQCHGIWEFSTPADERLANSRGLPYRPGAELTATRFLAQPTRNADTPAMQRLLEEDPNFIRDSFWPDGMVRVTGREYNGLIESPCFVQRGR